MVVTLVVAAAMSQVGAVSSFESFHGHQAHPKANYDSLFAIATPLVQSEEGSLLIESCLRRYGGVEKLEELESFRLTYDMKRFMVRDTVQVVRSFAQGRHYKTMDLRSGKERTLNGPESWYQDADTLIVVTGGRYRAELFSYLCHAMPLALHSEHFDEVRYGKRDADPLGYIYLEKADSLMMVVGIDPGDKLIKSYEGIIYQEESRYVFVNLLAGHGELEGYLFPREVTHISMGLEVGHATLKRAEINPSLDATEFRPSRFVNSGDDQ